ncbi:sulfite exporter TauE/SafE family protein [Pedobacter frigoris]|uniref:sulfite exporter TauE/SafE family protein n=1 Tax=Pedobacter frigoris TaxID=2571272 RepID=UPI0029306296|nr:sulfite exporter TauE/SafE family protein [Pedobacter frigoris]
MSIQDNQARITLNGKTQERKWKRIAYLCLIILAALFIGFAVYTYISYESVVTFAQDTYAQMDEKFFWMLLVGFFAQLVDGALGMGYGVVSTTLLLSGGLNPAVISGSIHTAEMFSSGASGFSHYRFGNVNKKLFKTLLVPGVLGAIAGAILLGYAGDAFSTYIRPVISIYTLLLGIRILTNAFKEKQKPQKVKRAGWLAGAGGFLDSFGGGGWGPLVTSTLISKGRTPKYVIGSVSLTEFFVTMASAVTFFFILGVSHWQSILGLIAGGVIAAPIAARLVGKLPIKKMFIGVSIIVIISSLRIIWMSVTKLL